ADPQAVTLEAVGIDVVDRSAAPDPGDLAGRQAVQRVDPLGRVGGDVVEAAGLEQLLALLRAELAGVGVERLAEGAAAEPERREQQDGDAASPLLFSNPFRTFSFELVRVRSRVVACFPACRRWYISYCSRRPTRRQR